MAKMDHGATRQIQTHDSNTASLSAQVNAAAFYLYF